MAIQKKNTTAAKPSGKLSLVIPCYNEVHRIDQMILGLKEFDQKSSLSYEVIIVDDGSIDKSADLIKNNEFIKQLESTGKFTLIQLPSNQGKGAALKAGVASAGGSHILTLDADMATKPTEVLKWLAIQKSQLPENEIWIATREHKDSIIKEISSRRSTGRIFNLIIRFLTPLSLRDTQCGFKLYPASIAKNIFAQQKSTGWAHDVELLYRAHNNNIPVKELPVTWEAKEGSKISVAKDALPMLLSVFMVSLRMKFDWFIASPIKRLTDKNYAATFSQEEKRDSTFRFLFCITSILLFAIMTTLSFDYGITGDDLDQKVYGEKVLDFYTSFGKDTSCLHLKVGNKENLYIYGGLFNMISAAANRYIGGLDEYDMRHLINAWAGFLAILFAGLLARAVGNWMTGFLALLLLATWPQFFGQSMNNPKDIPFALGYAMSIYYMVKLVKELPRPSLRTWIMTAVAIAFTINIRVGGLILVGMLFAFVGGAYILSSEKRKAINATKSAGSLIKRLLIISVAGYFGGLLFWPYGLLGPLSNPFTALGEISNFSVGIQLLFDGNLMMSNEISWNYIPQWLWITTPIVVLFAAITSCVVWYFGKKQFSSTLILLIIFATIFPWAYTVYQKSPLYDGMRQLLFIVPPIAVLAAITWHFIFLSIRQKPMQYAIAILLAIGIALPVRFSFANHPNEYVYFNELIGGIKGAFGKFDTDYYMNSIRKTSEHFKTTDAFKNATPQKKVLLATNAADPVNWYFRNDTNKVQVVFAKWNSPGNPKTRSARDWDYGIFFSRGIDPSMLKAGTWPSQKAVYKNEADGVPLSAIIERGNKSDLYGYEAMKKDSLVQAEKYFEEALKNNPQNEEVVLWLTQVKMNLNKPGEAESNALKYLELYPNGDQGYTLLGVAKAQGGKLDEGISDLNRAIKINPNNPQAYYYLALIYQQKGDKASAEHYMNIVKQFQQGQ